VKVSETGSNTDKHVVRVSQATVSGQTATDSTALIDTGSEQQIHCHSLPTQLTYTVLHYVHKCLHVAFYFTSE